MSTTSNATAVVPRPIPSARSAADAGMILAALGVLTFSFTVPFTKIAVRGMSPMFAALGRTSLAGVLGVGVLLATRRAFPSRRQLARLIVVIACVVFGFPLLTAYALHHVPSLHGAIVIGLLPLATAGAAVIRAGERPSPAYWLCSLVGLAAVVIFVVAKAGGSVHLADVLLLLAVIAAACGYTEGAMLSREMPGWSVISWALVLALPLTAALTIVAAVNGGAHATFGQWSAWGYTAVCSQFLGSFVWYAGLAKAGLARAGQLQLAQPALTMLWGWPLLGEHLDVAAVATVAVVLGAVAVGRKATVN